MNSSLDLNLLPIARQGGIERAELPDMFAVTLPRRTAHGREADSLIIYLIIVGNSPPSSGAQAQLLEQLAHKFYKTTGSLTAAMRTIAKALNLYLLDRNLRSTSVGRQGIGQLLLVALRADTLYLVQCGTVHAFLVTPTGTQHLYDAQSSGRGLGLSRAMPIRFLQIKMAADDYLVLATIASPGWSEATLQHPDRQGIELLRHQLLNNANLDYNAVIVQTQAGTGKLRLLHRKAEAPDVAHSIMAEQPTEAVSSPPLPAAEVFEGPTEDRRLGIPPVSAPATGSLEGFAEDKRRGSPSSPTAPIPSGGWETSMPRGEQPQAVPSSARTTTQQPAVVEVEMAQAGIPPIEPG